MTLQNHQFKNQILIYDKAEIRKYRTIDVEYLKKVKKNCYQNVVQRRKKTLIGKILYLFSRLAKKKIFSAFYVSEIPFDRL